MSCLSYHSAALQGIFSLWFCVLKTCVCLFICDYDFTIWKANGSVLNHVDWKVYLTFLLNRHRNQSSLYKVTVSCMTKMLFNYSHIDSIVPFFKWATFSNACIIRAFPPCIHKLLQPAENSSHSHLQTGRLGHFRLFVVTRHSRLLSFSVSRHWILCPYLIFLEPFLCKLWKRNNS